MNDSFIWLGNTESRQAYEALLNQMLTMKAGPWDRQEEAAEGTHPLLSIHGNVAVVQVRGSLINGSAGWMLHYGVTGYDDIREAAITALKDGQVGSILLQVESPGGHAEGPNELAKVIRRIDKVKPVVTYVPTKMYSAALWIGTAARKSYIAETAGAGSLGVVMVHKEFSKQLKDEGVTVKVIRAGREKMLANPFEPLTEKAQSNLEAHAQEMYDIFLAAVAEHRGLSAPVADKQFGQGVEFMGRKAVEAGLVDAVGTFEDAMAHAQKLASARMEKTTSTAPAGKVTYGRTASNATNVAQVSSNSVQFLAGGDHNAASVQGTAMPQPLSDLDIAAMAAGVQVVAGEATAATPSNPAAPAAPATPAAPAAPAAPATPAPTTDTPAPAASASVSLDAALAPVLASLNASQAEVGRLNTQVQALTAASEKVKPQVDGLLAIAREGLLTMSIGLNLGLTAEAVNAMAPEMVLSEHGRVKNLFKEKFKAGGVAASAATTEPEKKADAAPHAFFDLATKSTK
jgi:signal peptide peptidase SppA